MNEEVLSLKGIVKTYRKDVLNGLDFELNRGTVMGLVGKNGAGKTTMIKCALGLLKPQAGQALIFGEDAWNMSTEIKMRVGYVPQAMTGFTWMTAAELLAYTGAFYDRWDAGKVNDMMTEWDLDPKEKVGAMSEGQKQKLAIIQAMGHDPDLLILDEPVASLDPSARRMFLKQIIEINLSEDKSVLFATHITSDIERVAADVAFLREGRIAFQGDLDSLKDRIRRLHFQGESALPDPLPVANIIKAKVNGNMAAVTVDGLEPAQIARLERELRARITPENLNLEEIFLELNQ